MDDPELDEIILDTMAAIYQPVLQDPALPPAQQQDTAGMNAYQSPHAQASAHNITTPPTGPTVTTPGIQQQQHLQQLAGWASSAAAGPKTPLSSSALAAVAAAASAAGHGST
jgi:hypothetical protein